MFSNSNVRNYLICLISLLSLSTSAFGAVGFMGGGTIATVWGNDAANTGFRTGFNAGLILDMPLNENVSIRPEASFVQKGTQADVYDPFSESWVSAKGQVNYAEFPVLVSVKLNRASSVTTVINIGPAFAVPLKSQISVPGASIDVANMTSVDVSAVIGAGLELGSGSTRFLIDFRTDVGLTNMFKDMTSQEISDALSGSNPQLPVLDVDGTALEYKNYSVQLSMGVLFR